MPRPKPENVDEYLKQFPESTQEVLGQVRGIILEVLPPEAEEVISYAIPTYKMNKKPVVYFSGYDKHYSLYPRPQEPSADFARELEPYVAGKGTLRFSLDRPVPAELIKRIVEHRLQDSARGA